jgi:hypothetical protein
LEELSKGSPVLEENSPNLSEEEKDNQHRESPIRVIRRKGFFGRRQRVNYKRKSKYFHHIQFRDQMDSFLLPSKSHSSLHKIKQDSAAEENKNAFLLHKSFLEYLKFTQQLLLSSKVFDAFK